MTRNGAKDVAEPSKGKRKTKSDSEPNLMTLLEEIRSKKRRQENEEEEKNSEQNLQSGEDDKGEEDESHEEGKDMFVMYLRSKNMIKLGEDIAGSTISLVDIEWGTTNNKNDCGVFMMRHMETYFWHSGKGWEVGLTSRSQKILQILRGRYCETY